MRLSEFLNPKLSKSVVKRNEWIEENGLRIYLRKTHRTFEGTLCHPAEGLPFIDIGNITADRPGDGAFTAFRAVMEPQYNLYVESVLNERFGKYLERHGYKKIEAFLEESLPCYFKLRTSSNGQGSVSERHNQTGKGKTKKKGGKEKASNVTS